MVRTNEETVARSEEEKHNVHLVSGGSSNTGREIQAYGGQQKRVDREIGKRSKSTSVSSRSRSLGEIIRELIEDCRIQEAKKLDELKHIRSRISSLESLLEDVEDSKE
ncbi:MAG: hypothetical protein QNJ36_09025 [Calothrix sp. MO_167.B42]|nr:hypothetical protein [Calothrix sp. MO_167.B42]